MIVTPVGAPVADKVTGELKPPEAVKVILTVFELPLPTVTVDAPAAKENVALPSLQWLASRFASIDPNPVAWS